MFKPQLSSEATGPITFPKLASVKLDGIRCVTKFGGTLTRSLKPVPNQHIREILAKYPSLDGELVVGPANAPDVYRRTNSAVMSHEGEPDFRFKVFDDLACSQSDTFEQRLEILKLRNLPDFIEVLPQYLLRNQDELDEMYARALDGGFEGLILRNPTSTYKFGRCTGNSQDSLKCKPFADSEAVVLSAYEALENQNEAFTNELGQTERSTHAENKVGKGMVGGFIVKDLKSGIEFNCSAGVLRHSERTELWGKDLVGKIVKYRSMNYGVKTAPRFPRFIGWRDARDM